MSSSDGYCSIIHFEEGELGKIYKIKDSIQKNTIVNETLKNSGKKSSNGTIKDKNDVPTFDMNDCAMDIELGKIDTIDATTNNRSEKSEQKSDKIMNNQNIKSENDLQIDKKSNEEETEDIKLIYVEENSSDANKIKTKNSPPRSDVAPIICHKTPRRVQLITLSSPKRLKK